MVRNVVESLASSPLGGSRRIILFAFLGLLSSYCPPRGYPPFALPRSPPHPCRIECGNDGCRHRDRRDRMERHERTECPRRPAGCPACGKKLAAGDLELHEERECEKRSDACPNAFLGCYDVMPHHKIAAHVAHV